MKFNRSGLANSQPRICLSLFVVFMLCLTVAQAQTFKQNNIYTIVGGGATPSAPLSADLPGASGVIQDAAGNLYIAAPDSAYVFTLSSTGVLSNYAGLGFGGFSGDGKAAKTAMISAVTGVAMDSKGNIYLADSAGSRIRKVTPAGIISTVAGNGVKCDHAAVCGDGAKATLANLNLPQSVALDANGNVYISDAGDLRIRVVNTQSSVISIAGVSIPAGAIQTVAGNSVPCTNPQTACGDGGPARSASLSSPYGIALDSAGNIYIADTRDQKIRFVNTSGIISTIAGNGIGCTNQRSGCGDGTVATSAELHLPQGVFVDPTGNVYIADTASNRIRIVNATTKIITTLVDTTGAQGFAGDGAAAASAQLDLPIGIWLDSSGNLFISDSGNQRIRVVNNQASAVTVGGTTIQPGTIATIAGGGNGGDGGLATAATLALPWDVVEDAAGNLYIVDQGNNRIRKVTNPTSSTATITTVAGSGRAGYSGDGGLATAATLNAPSSIAFDSAGNMYIADSNNLVIREVNAGTGIISTVVGNGLSCFPTTSACGDGGVATSATFAFPLNITFDSAGNLYISDYQGYKIRKVVPSGGSIANGTISTVAGTGIEGLKGNNGVATSANLDHPAGLVVDSAANIYISDQYNSEIRRVSAGIITDWALNLAAKLAGDGGPAINGSMWNPLELAIDPAGNVYISGGNDNVVQRISAATGIYSTVAGSTSKPVQGGFSGDKGPAVNARMANLGAWADGSNNLFIADGGNNRVRYVPLAPAATTTPSSAALGQWALGTTGTAVPVTFTSTGGEDLIFTGITFTGTNSSDFSQTNTCGSTPATISPDVACTISVSLTPSAYGPESATMNIADNATGSPQKVTLTGSGPDFSISAAPNTLTIVHGSDGTSTISLTPQAKFAQPITLSCSAGLPTGASCSFSPDPVQMFGGSIQTSTLTLSTSASTPPGTYSVTVRGVFTPLSHPTTISLTIQ